MQLIGANPDGALESHRPMSGETICNDRGLTLEGGWKVRRSPLNGASKSALGKPGLMRRGSVFAEIPADAVILSRNDAVGGLWCGTPFTMQPQSEASSLACCSSCSLGHVPGHLRKPSACSGQRFLPKVKPLSCFECRQYRSFHCEFGTPTLFHKR
ncbi:hypothetical protein N7468_009616 [Penicillium chermesinum]|uniref:Uncharacterized protein n=1 Tax=Penicillium chermesinum TaxID=63820 RepID=A0A9W9TF02_9EURO|nr:uncharacterized protein N7468_009616 [Penicillium chermesinum]KAJ5220412.1 hypothetical protein N7468_009616 [Penicillium chermesinum]